MARIPLYYTFGNHMHWVDMEWLWGYHVLPGSIRDMLHFCHETGARGNVNFDGIGYEKLAAEDPEALQELREAVQAGIIEPVGCSYGQPYGLFHGGESNIRQRIYGARAVRRLLGVWPKTFWEEEFDFFPQLPQMLRGCGFEFASLFFQWTWHTPEVPKEKVPVVWWEGQDGSRLLCATRNKLNLHQWPEDMDATFAEMAANPPSADAHGPTPLILQWLELMPSPDWMCRSEVLLPKMRELLADERFGIKMATLGEYLRGIGSGMGVPPTRRYTMDDVWHGMSLGKNGDNMRRESFSTESTLLAAETLAAIAALLGRPYAQWDVYPTWELEEQWRNLLMAQHHDNDECEGLCGHVGKAQYKSAWEGACDILDRQIDRITDEFMEDGDGIWIYNPLGWERSWHVVHRDSHLTVAKVPAFGWSLVTMNAIDAECGGWVVDGSTAKFRRGPVEVDVDLITATIVHYANEDFPDGIPLEGKPLWTWCGSDKDGKPLSLRGRSHWWDDERIAPTVTGDRLIRLPVEFEGHPEDGFTLKIACEPHHDGIEIELEGEVPRAAPGMGPAFGMRLNIPKAWTRIESDEAYGVSEKRPHHKFLKKYPEGDWMTSPQWFEDVQRPFTSLTFSDFTDPDSGIGLLIGHNGSRQWFVEGEGCVRHILHAFDPWDEDREVGRLENRFRVTAHRDLRPSEKWRQTQEAMRECSELGVGTARTEVPSNFSALSCDSPNVVPTAFYRETEDYAGKYLDSYAGTGMGYPFVLRLVEFDGLATEATLTVSGTVAAAFKTNLLGQSTSTACGGGEEDKNDLINLGTDTAKGQSQIKVSMRPYEIATIYMDIVEGRKQNRDLDAKREIWATVHRVED